MKGLWINDKTFVSFSDKKTSLTEEIATRKGAIDFYSLGMYLPNPDPVLKKQGKDIAVYKELLTDAYVSGCVSSRRSGVLSLEWGIDRGKAKSRQAKVIESLFQDIDIYKVISEMLDSVLFGYQVMEVIWEKTGKYILPKDIVGKPQRWFVFDEENKLKLRTKANPVSGETLPEYKFLLIQHSASYENPYGIPELSKCFWPVTFKKGGLKFWVMFTEKYGMPFMIGKHPRGTSKEETDKLADMLESMIQDAIAVIPDDSSVEIMEAGSKSASADIYLKLLEYCNSEIAIALLGQNLTTQVKGGSYAAAESHMKIRKDIIESDKKLVEKTINQLIKWIYDLNFSDGQMPVFSMWEKEDVDKNLAERDKTLVDAGIKFTRQYWMKAYGFEDEDLEQNSIQQFSEGTQKSQFPDQQAVDDAIDSITPEELQKQMEGVLKPIIELIEQGNSYEEIMERLIEAYPDMDTSAIEDMLARAIFISELWGRLNARKD
jgi:phage gp29-like protein